VYVDSGGSKEALLDLAGGPDPPSDGAIFREKGRPIVKYIYRDTLLWAVQIGLNRSR